MTFVLVILLLAAVGATFVFYKKSRANEHRQLAGGTAGLLEDKRTEATVTNLRLGDIISYFDTDYVVEGRIDYSANGWPWTCFMLVDGENTRWLAVEEDDRLEASIWEEIDLDFQGAPDTLEYDGETFKLVEKGTAQVSQTGRTGKRSGMSCEYLEYEGSGDRAISVEKWGMETEVSIGHDVNPYSLDILPGGGTSFG